MTLNELNELVRNTIKSLVPVDDVIKYYPNAPRPAGSYATVNVAEPRNVGMRDIQFFINGEDVDEKVVMLFEAMVSINFYRDDARQYAAIFVGMLKSNSVVESFSSAGVGFIRASTIRDITFLQTVEYEDRAQVDLFLQFEMTSPPQLVTGIDVVKVTGEVDNSAEIIETIEIEIP